MINDGCRLVPWADALYACDGAWWDKAEGARDFNGLKITHDTDAATKYRLRTVTLRNGCNSILTDEAGLLGWGGNSGFHALNLAIQWGAKRIILVGYDLTIRNGVHWHGRHPGHMNNPDEALTAKWGRILDDQAPRIAALGVEVLNASPVSTLTAYRKVRMEDALC